MARQADNKMTKPAATLVLNPRGKHDMIIKCAMSESATGRWETERNPLQQTSPMTAHLSKREHFACVSISRKTGKKKCIHIQMYTIYSNYTVNIQ